MTTLDVDVFGVTADGEDVLGVEVDNGVLRGVLISYGARLIELHAPDASGRTADVVLGHGRLEAYERDASYMGPICGRCANRIRGGRFVLDGVEHQLDVNEPPNHLHGGRRGFDRLVWSVDTDRSTGAVVFSIDSPDGDQGYPGRLRATATYRFVDRDIHIETAAITEAPTIVNLVHHSYFNLAGHDQGPIFDHELIIQADAFTPVGSDLLPTGMIEQVVGTPFDFRTARTIGRETALDHNWVLRDATGGLRPVAVLRDPSSGRELTIETTEPGLQVYTGQGLARVKGKGGASYGPCSGVAIEPQCWPDSPNFGHFPDVVLRPGGTYRRESVFTFGAD